MVRKSLYAVLTRDQAAALATSPETAQARPALVAKVAVRVPSATSAARRATLLGTARRAADTLVAEAVAVMAEVTVVDMVAGRIFSATAAAGKSDYMFGICGRCFEYYVLGARPTLITSFEYHDG